MRAELSLHHADLHGHILQRIRRAPRLSFRKLAMMKPTSGRGQNLGRNVPRDDELEIRRAANSDLIAPQLYGQDWSKTAANPRVSGFYDYRGLVFSHPIRFHWPFFLPFPDSLS
jgi:hypothetical protein